MFNYALVFDKNIGAWDTSYVTNMSRMFNYAKAFNQNIGAWDTSNVVNMSYMFNDMDSFNQDISSWDVSKVTAMDNMFQRNYAFNQDLSDWCVLNFSAEPSSFVNNSSVLADENKPNWGTCTTDNTPPVVTITGYALVEVELNAIFTDPGATAVDALQGDITSSISVSGTIDNTVAGDYVLYYSATDHNNNTGTASRTVRVFSDTPIYMEDGTCRCVQATAGDTAEIDGVTYTVVDNTTIASQINSGNVNLCTSLVTSMVNLFADNTDFNSDISFWDTSNVTLMTSMFHGASSFNQNIGAWDTSSVTNMQSTFDSASSFDQNIGAWDVSSVIVMEGMFYGTPFNQDISNWDTSNRW